MLSNIHLVALLDEQRSARLANFDFTVMSAGAAATLPGGLLLTRASVATVQTGTSTVVTSGIAVDTARVGRRLDADPLALVFEEARTNIIGRGRERSGLTSGGAGAWGLGTATSTQNQTGIDGTVNIAWRDQCTSLQYAKYATYTATQNSYYATSIWYSQGPGSGAYQIVYGDNPGSSGSGGTAVAWTKVEVVDQQTSATAANNAALVTNDGRGGYIGGPIAAARDSASDLPQAELGRFCTEWIDATGASSATRLGERLYHPTGATFVSNGRIGIEYVLQPKGATTDYSAAMRLWTVDASNYAEISTAGVLTVVIGGVTNTTDAIAWAANDKLELWLAAGGSLATVVKYRLNDGAIRALTVAGATLGTLTIATTIDLLCNGTSAQFTARVRSITPYRYGKSPAWAADAGALFELLASAYTPGGISTPTGVTFTRASAATVQTSATTVDTTPAVDVLRVGQYSASSSVRGFVIEESRTNMVPDARDMSVASWSAGSSATLVASNLTSPDGASVAQHWTVGSGGSSKFRTASLTLNARYSFSQWTRGAAGGEAHASTHVVNGAASPTTGYWAFTGPRTLTLSWERLIGVPTLVNGALSAVVYHVPIDGQNQTANGGHAAGARAGVVDMHQIELGAFATEFISTSGGTATRSGERIAITGGSSLVPRGRLSLELQCIPKGARADYANTITFWYVDANNKCEINPTTGLLTLTVGGATNTCPGINWPALSRVQFWIEVGGSLPSVVKWSLDGGAVNQPPVTGSALGTLTISSACDILCAATANQLSSWLQIVRAYPDGTRPTWATYQGSLVSLRADIGRTAGTGVLTWGDVSGNAVNPTNATGAQQPTVITNGAGRTALRFLSASNRNLVASLIRSQPFSFLLIGQMGALGASTVNDIVVSFSGSVVYALHSTASYLYAGSGGGVIVTESGSTLFAALGTFDGNSTRLRFWHGSDTATSDTTGVGGSGASSTLTLGGITSTRNVNVDIAEFQVIPGTPSEAYVTSLISYARTYHGV
jgi:hypothetical protein